MKLRTIRTLAASLPGNSTAVEIQLLSELFDHAADLAFFVKDDTGRYLAVNDSLVKRHGFLNKSEVIGKRPCDICPGAFGKGPSDQDADVLRTGIPLIDHLEQQWYLPRKPVWCLTTKLPRRDTHGNIIGLIGISRDVRAPIRTRDIPPQLATALASFERNLAEPVSPSILARRAHLNPAKFARIIGRFFGLTPSQYITQSRIALASRLLSESDKPVADIAYECGFYDHSSFTRSFRQAMGVTPSEFRNVRMNLTTPGQVTTLTT